MINFIQSPGGLLLNDELVTNFCFLQIRPLFDTERAEQLVAIELDIQAPDRNYTICVNVSDAITRQILHATTTCRLLNPKIARSLDVYIIDQAVAVQDKGLYFRSFGLQRLWNGTWVFVAGSEILGNYGEYFAVVNPDISKIHLVQNPTGDQRETIVRLAQRIEENPTTIWPTFTYALLSSLRSRIMDLGLTVFPSLYLVGLQGAGKTMLASRYNLFYDCEDNPSKFGKLESDSTPKGIINAVSGYRDQVVLVDDLALGSSPSIRRERQKVIAEVLRFAANGSLRQTAASGKKNAPQTCQAGVVFTGEIPLTAASDITRMIEVPLKSHMSGGKESDRADAATVFRSWMLWVLPHLDDEVDNLRDQLSRITGGENARLETTKTLLLWVVELFYRFLLEKDIIAQQYYSSAIHEARRIFSALIEDQLRKVHLIQDNPPMGNLSWHILQGYRSRVFHVVSGRKKVKYDEDCIVENNALCVKASVLLGYLQGQPGFQNLTTKQMTKQLKGEGTLKDHSEKRASSKKIGGKRYLELNFDALRTAARHY